MTFLSGFPGGSELLRVLENGRHGVLPRGYIDGLTIANDTTDAVNDISVAPGCCRSTVNMAFSFDNAPSTLTRHQRDIEFSRTMIKQLDVSWAPENAGRSDRSGGRSSAAIANGTWHVFAIGGSGLPDALLLHNAADTPSVLGELRKIGGYTAFRRIGSILRESAAIAGFVHIGDKFSRKVPVQSVSAANPGTAAVSRTLDVPTGIAVEAIVDAGVNSTSTADPYVLITALSETDSTPSSALFDLSSSHGLPTAYIPTSNRRVFTDTSGRIRSRLSASDAGTTLTIITRGWYDRRDRDS